MNIAIRADASVEIGSGHVMRCLTLANRLRAEGARVVFVCRDLPGAMFDFIGESGYEYAKPETKSTSDDWQCGDAVATIEALGRVFARKVDMLIVDHYGIDSAWEKLLRPHVGVLMVVDDLANRKHDCDLLLDQNYYHDMESRYHGLVQDNCRTLLGPSFVLLRSEFAEARKGLRTRNGSVRRILVFFGGSDPDMLTQKTIAALRMLGRPDISADIIVGASNPHREEIKMLCAESPNLKFHCQISNMAELIAAADLGIGAGGATTWERCILGLPAITLVCAENQLRTTRDLDSIGAVQFLGWAGDVSADKLCAAIDTVIRDEQLLHSLSAKSLALMDDWRGVEPIMEAAIKMMNKENQVTSQAHIFSEYILNPVPDELWRRGDPIAGTKLGFCDTCGFVHLDPYPPADYLVEYYRDYEMPTPQANLSETARLLARNLDLKAKVLDMGCGDGGFLRAMHALGFENLAGFDQCPGLDRAKASGIGEFSRSNVWAFLDEAEAGRDAQYDAFVMVNVLEHVTEPVNLLRRLCRVMKRGALLCITVPNDFSTLQRAFLKVTGHMPWFVCLPDHVNYFDFNTLKSAVENNGFSVIDQSALYPLELYLMQDLDYIANPELGPVAHARRVTFEENMKKAGMTKELDHFYSTLASGGYGRDVMIVAKKA